VSTESLHHLLPEKKDKLRKENMQNQQFQSVQEISAMEGGHLCQGFVDQSGQYHKTLAPPTDQATNGSVFA
jgi:hypothetical protein